MKNKSIVYPLIFLTLSFAFIICIFTAASAFDSHGMSYFPGNELDLILLVIESIPVWVFLYLGAGLILKKYYQQQKPIIGTTFLFITLLLDALMWFQWRKECGEKHTLSSVFILPLLLSIGIFLLVGLPKFLPTKNQKPQF